MSRNAGSYIIGVFDCCRAAFEIPDRSGNAQDAEPEMENEDMRNCILIFGCPPQGKVSAVSTVALELIDQLQASALTDGSIRFPTLDFFGWRPGDDGDTVANFKEDLEFRPPTGQSVADNPLVQQNPVASVKPVVPGNPTEMESVEEELKEASIDSAASQSAEERKYEPMHGIVKLKDEIKFISLKKDISSVQDFSEYIDKISAEDLTIMNISYFKGSKASANMLFEILAQRIPDGQLE